MQIKWIAVALLAVAIGIGAGKGYTEDQKAIAKVIQTAYVEGLQNEGDTLKIDKGFHPSFRMIGLGEDGKLWEYPIAKWRQTKIERLKKGELPLPKEKKVSVEFVSIDVSDYVAVAKVHYYEGGEKTYVDFISLYKFDGDWKIISKIFSKE